MCSVDFPSYADLGRCHHLQLGDQVNADKLMCEGFDSWQESRLISTASVEHLDFSAYFQQLVVQHWNIGSQAHTFHSLTALPLQQ